MYTTKRKKKSNGLLGVFIFLMILAVVAGAALILSRGIGLIEALSPNVSGEGLDPSDITGHGISSDNLAAYGITPEDQLDSSDPLVAEFMDHFDEFTPEMVKLFVKNPDAREYVLGYLDHKDDTQAGELTAEECSGSAVPLLLQWDERWGYITYGSGPIGITGCGPTCLAMAASYLKADSSCTPASVAAFSETNGYYVSGEGTKWSLIAEGSAQFGLSCEELPLWEDSMVSALSDGKVIIVNMGPGDFTDAGHYIVITGYSEGLFKINDPNSPTRSARGWSYSELESQIRCLWALSA